MNNSISRFFIFIMVCCIAMACNKTENSTVKTPFNYYPLQTGKYIIYNVDSISYNDSHIDTSYTQIKEIIADTFYDNTGRLNYRIEKYVRNNDSALWSVKSIYSVLYTQTQIEKVEDNLRYIKLTTPVENGNTWNGNAYLGGLDSIHVEAECLNLKFLYNWDYTYQNIEQSATINGLNFDNTVTVVQSGSINLIEYNYAKEIYADGIGLISKEFYHYTTQNPCPECPWETNTECGYSVKILITEYN